MIAKHIKKNVAVKGNYGALIDYLTNSQGNSERVGRISITNCDADDVDTAKLEILATQKMNNTARADKTYHLLLSFDKGEKPTAEQLKQIEEDFCKALGFQDHQRISVAHEDTDNFHVHIAINKVNPKTLKIHNPYYDYKVLGKKSAETEEKYGFSKTNHDRNERSHAAQDFESQTGMESFITYMRKLAPEIEKAKSWKELHASLAKAGVLCRKKGNGLVFTSNDITVKASSVSRSFTLKKLEAKLGKFEASREKLNGKGYQEQPIKNDAKAKKDFAEYKQGGRGNNPVKNEIKEILAEEGLFRQVVLSQEMDPQVRQLLMLLSSMSTDESINRAIEKGKANKKKARTFRGYLKVKAQNNTVEPLIIRITRKIREINLGRKIHDFINAQLKLLHLKSLTRPEETIVRERMHRMQKRTMESRKRKGPRIL